MRKTRAYTLKVDHHQHLTNNINNAIDRLIKENDTVTDGFQVDVKPIIIKHPRLGDKLEYLVTITYLIYTKEKEDNG